MLVKPQLGDDVLQTDIDQTEAVNGIKDYVIDFGVDDNSYWEKWNSGKLIQRGRVTKLLTSNGVLEITFPIPFIRAGAYFIGSALLVSTRTMTCTTGTTTTTGVDIYYTDSRNGDPLTDTQVYSYEAVGGWK